MSTTEHSAEASVDAHAPVTFSDLKLRPAIVEALTEMGYELPTPIQAESIPVLLLGTDLLGQAATGTGKTAAFALPMLDKLPDAKRDGQPFGLVLVPTRELAIQVSEAMASYGKKLGARVVAVYGGQPIYQQLRTIDRGVDIVVATPGRAIDHIKRGSLSFDSLEMVVMDEADEMLDMGFTEDIETLLNAAPKERQTVLFSATMPPHIERLARTHLQNPERITIAREKQVEGVAPRVRQSGYIVKHQHKAAAMGRILDVESPRAAIVFCKTRDQVDTLTETLNARGHRAEALHGGMDQQQRDRVMGRLRNESANLLIATDVAARGLDIDHLTHVINFDVPTQAEAYVHRIGRVGRAGREGVAITIIDPRDMRQLKNVERLTRVKIAIETLPTVADLRVRRMKVTEDALRAQLAEGAGEDVAMRTMIQNLAADYDLLDVAAAAAKMAHVATTPAVDEVHIPEYNSDERPGRDRDRKPFDRERSGSYEKRDGKPRAPRGNGGPMTKIYIGAGRAARMRPQDLVGAIANESSLSGRDIGDIRIQEGFSLVEVPDKAVNEVIAALRGTTLKGKKVTVRRERF